MKSVLLILLLIFPAIIRAQEKTIHHQEQFWWSINTESRVTDKFGIIADFHLRRTDFLANTNFYFLRGAGSWRLSDQWSVALGYSHMWISKDVEASAIFQHENRIYQQLSWRQKTGRFSLFQRFQNEQRWQRILDGEGQYDRTRFTNRFRSLTSVTFQVFNNSNLPRLVVSDEIILHAGEEVIYNTFDQNRFFAGIKVPVSNDLSFDLGYMMVFQQAYSGTDYFLNNTLRWFFFYTPDFR